VIYPGLKSHPQHDIATRQQNGYGAMVTFYCVGGREQSAIILQNVSEVCSIHLNTLRSRYTLIIKFMIIHSQLRVFALAESLGAVESLCESPALMTHASVPNEQRKLLGIDDTLIRLSVGIESCVDLISDLDSALNAALSSVGGK
jgi:cystathionine gamma-lyase